ncbi:hypothetical protein BDY19DRAFT_972286 [Irpex rosettiformis]|uniref:Uncharacterized protein n=1 Tax=Irpex rosettiformis TaxID=378272 RepID=A0ACB8TQT4_9APHY|nr:hypothetical protein BDY19DRAFT_972286 [Irpex rosettiformis]
MGFDIVSLFSVRIFAAPAVACTVLFTITGSMGPLVPVVRAVLDACNDIYTQLVYDVFDVVRLSLLQLATPQLSFVGSCSTLASICSGLRHIALNSYTTPLFDYAWTSIVIRPDSLLSLRLI